MEVQKLKTRIQSKKLESGQIPQPLFQQIVKQIPIVSVEAIISKDDSLLLLRRKNSPAKGEWWFPGGRIRRGETFQEALNRQVKEETGLKVIKGEFINIYSRTFDERHDITIAYYCKCKGDEIVLNDEHSEYKYFKNIPKNFHPYLVELLQDLKKTNLHFMQQI